MLAYIVGGKKPLTAKIDGKAEVEVPITRKFFGDDAHRRAGDRDARVASARCCSSASPAPARAGCPSTSPRRSAAARTLTIQGTAGTTEEQIKYSWNIARVIAEGPKPENLIPSPTMVAMRTGGLLPLRGDHPLRAATCRTRSCRSCSDKAIAIPELPDANMVFASPGFNIIATANTRDQGVNELSAALKRRFNYVYIPIVGDQKTEVEIVQQRSEELLERYKIAGAARRAGARTARHGVPRDARRQDGRRASA